MPVLRDIGPLTWNVPITDQTGRPTPEFQRRWDQQRSNNSFIGSVTLGTGVPTGTPEDGAEYIDTSIAPYVLYVGSSGTWHQVSSRIFLDLADVPNSYTTNYLVQVNASADGLVFNPLSSFTANPTAIASDVAVNGSATTFMRSDAAPAIQKTSSTQFGVVKVDGTTITAVGGVISGASPVTAANPTATASNTAVNGVATTYMRSDAAPAIQLGSSSVFGLLKVDGTTITASGGVISAASSITGANPTATASDTAINGSAITFMRSDAAPAIQKASSSVFGLVKVDGTTITASGGIISSTGGGGGGTTYLTQAVLLGGNPTTAFCFRGFLVKVNDTFKISALWAKAITPISGQTYKAAIVELSSVSGGTTVGAPHFSTAIVASSSSLQSLRFSFSTPITLTAGSIYGLVIGCTSGAATDIISMQNGGEWVPTLPIKDPTSCYIVQIASTTIPAGTTWSTTFSVTLPGFAVEWQY